SSCPLVNWFVLTTTYLSTLVLSHLSEQQLQQVSTPPAAAASRSHMRWFCVHPALPANAALRLRSAPDSNARVCGRVSKGKALAALAPAFHVPAADGGAAQRWLRVALSDADDAAEGFVMTTLPDGTPLLAPWEHAGVLNCCRVLNAHAALFDEPSATAQVVGRVEEGEGVQFLYAVEAVEGARARIRHDVFASVWIEIAELEPLCVRLRHSGCFSTCAAQLRNFAASIVSHPRADVLTYARRSLSAAHAFYALNDELPPEAQIAIRSFPSKSADAVGLLSRGEVLEVVARSGSWLQVATALTDDDNGDAPEAWIMWETDAWRLLVEAPAHSSGACSVQLGAVAVTVALPPPSPEAEVAGSDDADDAGGALDAATDDGMQWEAADEAQEASSALEPPSESVVPGESAVLAGDVAREGGDSVEAEDVATNAPSTSAKSAWEDRPLNLRRLRQNSSGSASATPEQQQRQSEASGGEEDAILQLSEAATPQLCSSENVQIQWDDRPIRPQTQRDSDADEAVEPAPHDTHDLQLSDSDAGLQDDSRVDTVTDATDSVALWDETPVGGSSSATTSSSGQAWDEIPVGGSKRNQVVWDEYPPGFDSEPQVGVAHTTPDDDEVEAVAPLEAAREALVAEDAETDSDHVEAADKADEAPLGGGQPHSAWDETPVGGGSRRQQDWDEYPPGFEHEQQADAGSAAAETGLEEELAEPMVMDESTECNDSNAFEVDEDMTDESVVVVEMPSASWDEISVGGIDQSPNAWDATPVGGGDSNHVWSEYPAGASVSEAQPDAAMETVCEGDEAFDEPMAEEMAATETVSVERDAEIEVHALSKDETPVRDDSGRSPNAWDETPVGTSRRKQVWEKYPSEASSANLDAAADQGLSQDTKGKMTLADLDGPDEEGESPHEQDAAPAASPDVQPAPMSSFPQFVGAEDDSIESVIPLIEDDGQAVTIDDMIVDGAGFDFHDGSRSVPMWDESPIKPTARFYQDTSIGTRSGKRFESVDGVRDARGDSEQPSAFAAKLSAHTSSTGLVRETRAPVQEHTNGFGGGHGRDARRSPVGDAPSAGRRLRTPEYSPPKNGSDGLSFLTEFGIRAYLRHKQILITSNEELSQSLFQTVVYGNDPDRILELLTANEPPCDEWMVYSPAKVRVASPEPATHSFLDVLYARESGKAPSTPNRTSPSKSDDWQPPPRPSGARKSKMSRFFNRKPVQQSGTLTYDLIMSDADPDKILEAEFGDEPCDLPILGPYKYPTLSGDPLGPAQPSRSPVGTSGASSLTGSRFLAAPPSLAGASSSTSAGTASGGHLLSRDDASMPVRTATPPAAEPTNPLKRT
ncbi:hypothetical protein PybrP1_008018, partial [[Pythium] brassicae (nom. inval.)]